MGGDKAAPQSRGALRRARYREIAKVLWEERVLSAFKGSAFEEHAPTDAVEPAPEPAGKEKDLPPAVRIRHALERLGPAFIKIGQILATRRDLVTPDLAAELAKLQDDVPTLPWEEMRERIEDELGGSVERALRDLRPDAHRGRQHRPGLPRDARRRHRRSPSRCSAPG